MEQIKPMEFDYISRSTFLLFASARRPSQALSTQFDHRKFITLSDRPCLKHVGLDGDIEHFAVRRRQLGLVMKLIRQSCTDTIVSFSAFSILIRIL